MNNQYFMFLFDNENDTVGHRLLWCKDDIFDE